MKTFRQLDSRLQGHPCMNKTPGVEMSTGSLGHGLSVTLGMALAARLRQEAITGATSSSATATSTRARPGKRIMAAAKFRPERLVVLVDYNKVQLDGPSDEIMPMDPLPDKFRAFNWNVAPRVYDGHDMADDPRVVRLDRAANRTGRPAVIYRTHKGRGVSFMEDNDVWHGAVIDDAAYREGPAGAC